MRRNTIHLKEEPFRRFLDPDGGRARYVVIAIDPAAGGKESEEAFVIFLVSGTHIALFGGRIVSAKEPGTAANVIPLRFVLALFDTVKKLATELRQIFDVPPGSTYFPSVLVVLETNFAYGAAIYMHTETFLCGEALRQPIYLFPSEAP